MKKQSTPNYKTKNTLLRNCDCCDFMFTKENYNNHKSKKLINIPKISINIIFGKIKLIGKYILDI